MIRHIVTFKLSGTPEERKQVATRFAEAIDRLPASIPCLKRIETGINANPTEDWDVVLTADVDTWEDLNAYANHPDHLAAAALLKGHKENRACVDYEI